MANTRHNDITDASKLHYAKAHLVDGLPTWNEAGWADKLAIDQNSGLAFLCLGSGYGDWRMAVESTRRLRAHKADPQIPEPTGGDIEDYTLLYPGIGSLYWTDNSGLTTLSGSSGETADGSTDRIVQAIVSYSDTGTAAASLYCAIPEDFSGWDSAGIQLKVRLSGYSGSGTARVLMRVYDPGTGASVATASATATGTSTTWTTIQITGATLGSTYAAGDLLRIALEFDNTVAGGGGNQGWSIGTLSLNWN